MSVTLTQTTKHCHNCKIESNIIQQGTLKKCSTCKVVYYCSKECQRNDWPIHKELCKKVEKQTIYIKKGTEPLQQATIRTTPEELTSTSSIKKQFDRLSKSAEPYTPPAPKILSRASTKSSIKIYVNEKNYPKLLEVLHSGLTTDSRISLLENTLKHFPHPGLYLELSKAYFEQASLSPSESYFAKSITFRTIGLVLSDADADCVTNDPTCKDYVKGLAFNYPSAGSLQSKYPKISIEEVKKEYKLLLKEEINRLLPNLDKSPSPAWIAKGGMNTFMGIQPKFKSPEECLSIKKESLQGALVFIKKEEGKQT